ncbi:PWWP DOMAIN PROTEIN [Salix viminalis]|uniref:PWWP DOMAIN PROTEIN n=1 Tax=Salix viminalis TaxID=40686 RepID=A0A9Q0SF84_SALVM|nr:PWWP DOMAIN PROTEIN [Salix viminalis]
MAPTRRKSAAGKAAAAAAARRQWKVGDLVLAKVKGFPAWPATVSEPEKWGYPNPADWKKILVYFFGTQQIAFCNPADVEPFTEEKKQNLLMKRQGRGADFVRAVQEIIDSYEKLKKQDRVDLSSDDDPTHANGGNSLESSNHFEVKDQRETSEATITGRNDPSLQTDDASAEAKIGSLQHKDVSLEQPADNLVIREKPIITTYTSRKRSGGLRSRKRIMQEKAPSIERSRSSSRLESSRFQNIMMPPDDGNRSSGDMSIDFIQDRSLRSTRQIKKSPDDSECDNADSSAFVSNVSVEDNGSEIITADSDSLSLNEGSTLDSGFRLETTETAVQCLEGDVELSRGLDFQIKAVVIKKKRKQSRKRGTDEVAEPTVRLETEADVDVRLHDNNQNSQFACENLNITQTKEDGDEHLPLVKRARVRMGKQSSLEEEHNNFTQAEEKRSTEVAFNAMEVDNSFFQPEERTSLEAGVNILEPISSSSNSKGDSKGDLPAHRDSLVVRGVFSNVSPSKNCTPTQADKSQLLRVKDIQSFSCSADSESALPPTKRLHRALEAMSANASEGQAFIETSTVKALLINGSSVSMMSASDMVTISKENSESEEQIADSPGNMVSSFSSGSKTILEETNKSSLDVKICKEAGSVNGPGLHKEVLPEATDQGGDKDPSGLCFETGNTCISIQAQSPLHLMPNLDRRQVSLLSHHGSLGQLLLPKDEGNSDGTELKDFGDGNANKEPPTSKDSRMSPNIISQADDTTKFTPQSGANLLQFTAEEVGYEDSETVRSQINSDSQANGICEVAKDVNFDQRQKDASHVSFSEYHLDDKDDLAQSSPPPADIVECPAQIFTPNASVHVSTSESVNFIQNSGSSSPNSLSHPKKIGCTSVSDEDKIESAVPQRPKSIGKWNNCAEAHAALSSFEAMLGSLTRTKESISRATRMAIDCAKFGVSAKVVEILARSLESESNLHKRVDLFFLVDSIAQCSRGLKGDAGGIYPSAIQTVLPRLLSAAAPPGSFAHENRRQCLKVLRLWLERRILSESIIRHHMRELDILGGSSSAGLYSRRSARTERALDDPVRDMEGMLVDEYGSNSSFQLPGFCMPRMLKDEDDGSDSDGGFEAVTPEHYTETPEYQEFTPAVEKHTHILEDVDGELEMEDVAPSCEAEMSSTSGIGGGDAARNSHNQLEQCLPQPFAPPLPQDVPPSSPPLPSSPPPPPPPPPPSAMACSSAMPDPYTCGVDSNIYTNSHDLQDDLRQPSTQNSVAPRTNPSLSNAVPCRTPECRDQIQVQHCDSTRSFSNYPVCQSNNVHRTDGPSFHHKAYPPRPQHPPPSNQFSYVHANQHVKSRREIPPPSYIHRFQPSHNFDCGNFSNNHERMGPGPYELNDGWRFPAPFPGPRYPDKAKASYAPVPYDGPPREPTRLPHQEWDFHAREMHHRNFMPSRPPPERAIPVSNRAPSIWRPR